MRITRFSSHECWLVGMFAYAIFLSSAATSLYAGDAGELTVASYVLGNAHPPGYPLYLLIAKLASFLPLGGIAWRLNLLNAFFGGVVVSLFYLLARMFLTRGYALISALFLISSATFYSLSLFTEVYHVQIIIFLLLLLTWLQNSHRSLLIMALLFGLGMVSHYGMLLLMLGLLPFILLRRDTLSIKRYILGTSLVCLGLATFLYLPLRAANTPQFNWGNPDNYTSFIDKLTRSEYSELGSEHSVSQYIKQLGLTAKFLSMQGFDLIYLLVIPGFLFMYLYHRQILYLLLSITAIYTLLATYFLNYQVTTLALNLGPKFFVPIYLVAVLFIGAGLEYVIAKSRKKSMRYLLTILAMLTAVSFISYQGIHQSQRSNTLYYDYGKDILNALPFKARLMSRGDNPLFVTLYMQQVENRRPDVVLTATEGNIFPDEYGYADLTIPALKAISTSIIKEFKGPLFYTNNVTDLPLKPHPLLYQLVRTGDNISADKDLAKHLHNLPAEDNFTEMMTTVMLTNRLLNYAYFVTENGGTPESYLQRAKKLGWDIPFVMQQLGQFHSKYGNHKLAIQPLQRATELEPKSYETYNDLGLAYKHLRDYKAAKLSFNQAVELNPGFALAYYNLAVIHLEENDSSNALLASDKAYNIYPGYRPNLYLRGLIYQRLGKNNLARKHFEEFIHTAHAEDAWTQKARSILSSLPKGKNF